MNERIRELWNQANSRYTNDYALSGKPREEWRTIPDLFAELIVQECMACSTWVGKMNNHAIEPVHTAQAINQRIRKQFGVEE